MQIMSPDSNHQRSETSRPKYRNRQPAWVSAMLAAVLCLAPARPGFAAGVSVPDCPALAQWSAQLKRGEMMPLTPKVQVSTLLRPDRVEPLFGAPLVHWQHEDFAAVIKQMTACVRDANTRRDKKAAGQLSQASRVLGKGGQAMRRIDHFREAAARDVQKIIDEPGTPEMGAVIDAAVAALNGDGGMQRPNVDSRLAYVAGYANNLKGYRDYLTEDDRQALVAKLEADRAGTVAEGEAMEAELAQARQAMAAAPATADGLRTLQQLEQAPVLTKVPRAEADAFRQALGQRQIAIRAELNRQQAEQAERAAAEARRPIEIAQRLEQLFQGNAVDALSLNGLAPGMSRDRAVSVLKHQWQFDFKGGLPMMNDFVATPPIFPALKAERRNGGKVELGINEDGEVGQVRYVEFYKAMLINTTPQAWLSQRLGDPDEVRPSQGGRLLIWHDGGRRLQVLATNQIEEAWRIAGYQSELAISVWNADYEDYLAGVDKRCDAIMQRPRAQVSMNDSVWFGTHCGLTGGSSDHPGI